MTSLFFSYRKCQLCHYGIFSVRIQYLYSHRLRWIHREPVLTLNRVSRVYQLIYVLLLKGISIYLITRLDHLVTLDGLYDKRALH